MRILFITHYFQPEPNFFMCLPFAKELVRRGHTVQVLTGFPNYPGGRIYDGYKIKFLQKEIMEGITVYRFPLYPSHDRSSVRRIFCYLSLAVSMGLIGPFVVQKADVAYVVQGPATLGLPATILKWLRGIPFVYNIQDMWPDTLMSTGMFGSRVGTAILNKWCNFIYRRASAITVIAPGMKKVLVERGVPEEKIGIICNWCDDSLICRDELDSRLAGRVALAGKFNIVFAGNMGKAQSLDAVIEAAAIIEPQFPDIQFVFIGSGVDVERLKSLSKQKNLSNTLFLSRRPVSEIGPILRLADVLLVHLRDDPLFEITIPSKTQAYMALGRPILMAVRGDAARLVQKARAGLICEPENPASISQAVMTFFTMSPQQRRDIGDSAKMFYDRELSFSHAVKRYEEVFLSAARHRTSVP